MTKFLITFYRNIRNNPRLFLINISGFSIGVVATLFIYLYVFKEYKTDRFHENHKDIYRVVQNWKGTDVKRAKNFFPLGELLQNEFSEIQDYTRYLEASMYEVSVGSNNFREQKMSFVDRSFFKIFDFELEIGDYNQVFDAPDNIIISKEMANRYFNTTDVIRNSIEVQVPGDSETLIYRITGILKEYPEEATLQPQIITDIKVEENKNLKSKWNILSPQLFLFIPNYNNPEKIASRISEIIAREVNATAKGYKFDVDPNRYELQSFTNIYFNSLNVDDELPKGDKRLAKILLAIAIILLSITFINSVISTLGLSLKNQRNDQIHNVLGCSPGWLRRKIISESILFATLAFVLSLILYPLVHHLIVRVSNYQYGLYTKSDTLILLSFFLVLVLFGILSGLIQNAFVKNNYSPKLGGLRFGSRKVIFNRLIQFQILVFIVASVSMFVIVRQIKLVQNIDMGFDIDNTFSIGVWDQNDADLFKEEFQKYSFVKAIASGEPLFKTEYRSYEVKVLDSQDIISTQIIQGDHEYLTAYNIKLVNGSNLNKNKIPVGDDFFNWKRKANSLAEVLVNEEFVRKAGLDNPIGTIVEGGGIMKGEIVGVIENLKNLPVYHSIKPMIIAYDLSGLAMGLVVSVQDGAEEQFMEATKAFYKKRNLEDYFDLLVWQYDFEKEYQKEKVFSKLIMVFTVVILFILLLGLVGLSLFISEGKTKEIGVRKVNGAKVREILAMLNKDFVKWVAIAFVIACPIAYYAMSKWLENFAYKTTLSWWIFDLAGLLALGIALLTVSWQSWKAATRNPVEALRYE